MAKLDRDLLTPGEVMALAAAPSRRAPTGIRNRALILLLAATGLRIAEALALRPKDVDIQQGTVSVHRGKGGADRIVAVTMPEAADALARWTDRRAALGINGRRRLFCTLPGGPMQSNYVRVTMRRLGKRAGIEKRIHPHGFRHFYSVMLARSRTPVSAIQATLGHRSLATTASYLARIAPEEHLEAARDGMARAWAESVTGRRG